MNAALEPQADPYSVLNVRRDASDEEIKRAYKVMAQLCHPDKHARSGDEAVAAAAERNFQRAHAAYDLLIDPQRRRLYDEHGHAGVAVGMQLATRFQSPEEFRAAFQEEMQFQADQKLEARMAHSGLYEFSLSAVDALRFNPWHERFSLPQLTELVMNNEVTMPISAKDTFSIGGAMQGRVMRTARNQRHTVGTSGMAMTYARQFSPHSDASASVNVDVEGTRLSLAVARQLTEHSRGEMAAVLQADTLPSVVVSTTRKISECWHGRIDTEMSPAGSGVSVSAKFLSPRSFIKADVKLGLHPQNGIRPSVAVSAPLSRRSRVKLELGLLHVGVGAIHVIGEDMRGGWTVLVTPFGLVWKLSFNRHQQKFAFPILLTPRVTTLRTAAALVAPPVILLTLKHLVYKPCAKRWRDGLRRKHAPATAAARVKAAADVRMMAAAVTRRRAKQLSSGGLVIVCARYGAVDAAGYAAVAAHPPLVVPPPLSPRSPLEGGVAEDRAAQHHWGQQQNRVGGSEQEGREGQQSDAGVAAAVAAEGHSGGGDALGWLDVTDAMQFLVTDDSTLDLAAGLSYTGLTGFADPCPGEHKRLVVKYLFRGQPYILQVADGEALSLPCARTTV